MAPTGNGNRQGVFLRKNAHDGSRLHVPLQLQSRLSTPSQLWSQPKKSVPLRVAGPDSFPDGIVRVPLGTLTPFQATAAPSHHHSLLDPMGLPHQGQSQHYVKEQESSQVEVHLKVFLPLGLLPTVIHHGSKNQQAPKLFMLRAGTLLRGQFG